VLTNATGLFVSTHTYFGFGEEIVAARGGVDTEKMVFTGHERDFNTNAGPGDDLDYMHARYCNPNTGRFLSVDPVGGRTNSPTSWNRYSYTRNNPLAFTDPTGMYEVSCTSGDSGCQAAAAAFEEQRQLNLASVDELISGTAKAFGDPGEKNGVKVGFSDLEEGRSAETVAAISFTDNDDGGSFAFEATVTFDLALDGVNLRAAIGHEGQHLADGQTFFSTFTSSGTFDSSKNLTSRELETRAYLVTHQILRKSNAVGNFPTKRGGVGRLGVNQPQVKVDRTIDKIINGPLYAGQLELRQFPEFSP